MAKPLRRKKDNAGDGTPPPGIDPAHWDPVADPDRTGVLLSGSDAPGNDYGDVVTQLRRRVMAGHLTPVSIQRPEAAWRLSGELGRTPHLHEVHSVGLDGGIWAARRTLLAATKEITTSATARSDSNRLAEVRAAYDLTDDEYQQWLAARDADDDTNEEN